jgi:non-heme chloroperoxidase
MRIQPRALVSAALALGTLGVSTMSAQPAARLIEVEPGVKIEVLDYGGRGRGIVLVPGYGRTAHDFDTFGPAVAAAGFHSYAISRRGFGGSSRPPTGYSADRLADDVLAVMDSLHIATPILAGHSLGGEELSSIGSRFPKRVTALVYLDAAYGYAFFDEADVENRYFVDKNEVIRGLREMTEALEAGSAEAAHRVIGRLLATDLPALRETLEGLDKRVPATSPDPRRSLTMRLRPGVDRMVFEGLQRYTSVTAPVLAIFALKGMYSGTELDAWQSGTRHEVRAVKRAAPRAEVLILPNATHDVFRSNESDVITSMRSFLAKLP